MTKTFH